VGAPDLGIRTYDVLTQTVVSLDEAAGSNEFLTRDQVGRALYNCIVLGDNRFLGWPRGRGAGSVSGSQCDRPERERRASLTQKRTNL
jgi:hypothetical protein